MIIIKIIVILENFKKRYDKFKNNNLPTPFWDDERFTLEYVYKDDNPLSEDKIKINYSLTESLGDIAFTGFYYSFQTKILKTSFEGEKRIEKEIVGHSHAHSFEDVVRELYRYPESFNILEEDKEFYSKQELEYLRRVKKYLLFIGLKDLDKIKPPMSRFKNKKHDKYKNVPFYNYSNELINDIINEKRDYVVSKYYEEYSDISDFKKIKALIRDEEDNIKLFIEYTNREIKEYKDVKNTCKIENLQDDDKVVITYFNILEKFDGAYE